MKKSVLLFLIFTLLLVGCNSEEDTNLNQTNQISQNKRKHKNSVENGEIILIGVYNDSGKMTRRLDIDPEKKVYSVFNDENEQTGFIDIELGTFEEQVEDYKVIGKVIDKFTLNNDMKEEVDIYSLKDIYKNLIKGVVKIETYSKDKLIIREFYKNGQNIMEYNEWHENGKQKKKGNYFEFKKDDKWHEWNEKGQLIKEEVYSKHLGYSNVIEAYNSGIIKRKYSIDIKTGNYTDLYEEFYPNGKRKIKGVYASESRKHDRWYEWNEKGQLIKIEYYSTDGILYLEEFDSEKKIARFIKGERVKEYQYSEAEGYYNDAFILRSYKIKGRKKDGEYIEYYLDNAIQEFSKKIKEIGEYKNDLKNGEWKFYDNKRNLTGTKFFIDGKNINEI